MVARSVPESDVKSTDAYGLTESYLRLRVSVRSASIDLGGSEESFDAEFPQIESVSPNYPAVGGRIMMDMTSKASHAATLLRQLAGYVEGLIEAVVIEQRLDVAQIQAAREAARQPVGFR
jgi:hypothetical protein